MTANKIEEVYEIGTRHLIGYKVFIPVHNDEQSRLAAARNFDRLLAAFGPEMYRNNWGEDIESIKVELAKPRTEIPKYKVVEEKSGEFAG